MTDAAPTVSVGLAVRNASDLLPRCIESVLSQDYSSLELVISDNASDDGTPELLREYARNDSRVRLNFNERNIGIHANYNVVLQSARGRYYRWISADDWLEPDCLGECVRALDADPEAIGVTTYFTILRPDGSISAEQYEGEFPVSADPARRFERMLWFFHAGDAKYDPLYGVFRRDVLLNARPQHGSEQTDWLLAAELALTGRIIHIPRELAHRTKGDPVIVDRVAARRQLDPERGEQLKSSLRRLHRELLAFVLSADLTEEQVRRCKRALRKFWLKDLYSRGHFRASTVKRRVVVRSRHRESLA